ncbi:MAG: hypothetical protein U0169_05720 [Polyangiaceae bacterium]
MTKFLRGGAVFGAVWLVACSSGGSDGDGTGDGGTSSDSGTTTTDSGSVPGTDSGSGADTGATATDAGAPGDSGGDAAVDTSPFPRLAGNPSLSATTVAVGGTISITAPVNAKAKVMKIYLGCLQNPGTNKATLFAERSTATWTAKGTKPAGASTITATLTIPNESFLKQDANQKCRFGIMLQENDASGSQFQNASSYTWNQTAGTVPTSDTKYVQIDEIWSTSSTSTAVVSNYDIPFFGVTF